MRIDRIDGRRLRPSTELAKNPSMSNRPNEARTRPHGAVTWAALPAQLSAVLLLAASLPGIATAVDAGLVKLKTAKTPSGARIRFEPILQPYEPITGGYTHDGNDTGFMDVNLSLKVRLLPLKYTPPRIRAYFAMSTRFGFYWGSRPNSPVIGKSYNPLLLIRYLPTTRQCRGSPDGSTVERAEYIDFIPYAHQSNGQLVHTQQEYAVELASLHVPSYTNNFIHRGWDYVGFIWKKSYCSSDVATYFGGDYFLPRGFLQGRADEYHSWEDNREGKPRRAVDGLMFMIEYPSSYSHFAIDSPEILSRPNITLKYLTGYDTPFAHSTIRAEFGFQFFSLPLALWVQHGYMSSLAMYYQKTTSWGLEVRFESF
jgi:hypothetical protein